MRSFVKIYVNSVFFIKHTLHNLQVLTYQRVCSFLRILFTCPILLFFHFPSGKWLCFLLLQNSRCKKITNIVFKAFVINCTFRNRQYFSIILSAASILTLYKEKLYSRLLMSIYILQLYYCHRNYEKKEEHLRLRSKYKRLYSF